PDAPSASSQPWLWPAAGVSAAIVHPSAIPAVGTGRRPSAGSRSSSSSGWWTARRSTEACTCASVTSTPRTPAAPPGSARSSPIRIRIPGWPRSASPCPTAGRCCTPPRRRAGSGCPPPRSSSRGTPTRSRGRGRSPARRTTRPPPGSRSRSPAAETVGPRRGRASREGQLGGERLLDLLEVVVQHLAEPRHDLHGRCLQRGGDGVRGDEGLPVEERELVLRGPQLGAVGQHQDHLREVLDVGGELALPVQLHHQVDLVLLGPV